MVPVLVLGVWLSFASVTYDMAYKRSGSVSEATYSRKSWRETYASNRGVVQCAYVEFAAPIPDAPIVRLILASLTSACVLIFQKQ